MAGVAVVLLVWPGTPGLSGAAPWAQLVALRGVQVVGLAVLALLAAAAGGTWVAVARRRTSRRPAGGAVLLTLAVVFGLGATAQVVVLAGRGVDGSGPGPAPGTDLVVLSFNTFDAVGPDDLADLVLAQDADVAVLPETSGATARHVADALADAGHPMSVLATRSPAAGVDGTALLIGDDLGDYARAAGRWPAAGRLESFAAAPVGDGRADATAAGIEAPPLVAVHALAPSALGSMAGWRADTSAVAAACRTTPGVVVAGDLNATLDHPGLADLGPCVDAAEQAGAAGLGTWPASVPSLLAAPIDHVLVDARVWRVTGFAVLPAVGASDHRPVVAYLARR